MLNSAQIVGVGLSAVIAFIITFSSTPLLAAAMRKREITGKDVHKTVDVYIPEMCGLAIIAGLTGSCLVFAVTIPESGRIVAAFLLTVILAGGVGFLDDLRPLSAKIKPLLTAIAAVPLVILHTYSPDPVIPFVGHVTLTIVYPLLILVAIPVTANAVNMMDVLNGSMPGTVSIIAAAITTILLLSGEPQVATLSAGLLAASLAFYYYNRFPARVFSGDTGTLAVGAALGAIAILGRIETVVVVALIPQIMNAFSGLSSVGRLYERREIHERPIQLLGNGTLQASSLKRAPITLTRLILASGPTTEKDVVRGMMIMTVISSLLAFLTYWGTVLVLP